MAAPETQPMPGMGSQPVVNKNVLLAAAGRLQEVGMNVLKQRKPWAELVDRNSFAKPTNLAEATSRIRKNVTYFKVNYIVIMLLTLVLTFLANPSSLLVVAALMGGWAYVFVLRTAPLVIAGRTLSDREKLMAMAGVSVITVFFLTSVGTVLFSALSISCCVIALHGATRVPDDLFLEEQETNTGLLGGLLPAATTTTTGTNNV